MLDPEDKAAVKAVLQDLAEGTRVNPTHIPNLLGIEHATLCQIADTYPKLELVSLADADLVIHNSLNLYVNGLDLRSRDWNMLGTSLAAVERAFALWQRQV